MSTRAAELGVSTAAAKLLLGPVYEDESSRVWSALLDNEAAVREYVAVLGLRLVLDNVERYAFLRRSDDADEAIPPLMRKHVLSHHVTVLLVVLRERLAAADAESDPPRAIVTQADLVEQLRLYYPDGTLEDRIVADIGRAENLGYLRKLKGPQPTYEIRRILKSVVTAEWLAEYRVRLLTGDDPDAVLDEPVDLPDADGPRAETPADGPADIPSTAPADALTEPVAPTGRLDVVAQAPPSAGTDQAGSATVEQTLFDPPATGSSTQDSP